jgi:membrane protein DedA with SNARE-associated domain
MERQSRFPMDHFSVLSAFSYSMWVTWYMIKGYCGSPVNKKWFADRRQGFSLPNAPEITADNQLFAA